MVGSPIPLIGTPAYGTGVTATVNKPTGLQDGDVICVALRAQGVLPGTQVTFPVGFDRATGPQPSTERAQGIFYKPVLVAADEVATTYSFGNFSSGRWVATPFLLRGCDLAEIVAGGHFYVSSAPVTQVIPAYDVTDTPYLIISMWADERTAGNSMVPASKPAGYTDFSNEQSGGAAAGTTGSRTAFYIGTKTVEEGGSLTVASSSLTWPGTAAGPRALSVAFKGMVEEEPEIPVGLELKDGSGDPVYMSYLDGEGNRLTPALVKPWLPGFDAVADVLAKPGATISHRGGSAVWPEMSEYAYDRSVLAGYGVLEFSCGFTSDEVPFGLGDQYLDRVAGVTGSVDQSSMTWATLVSTYENKLRPVSPGVYQPFYKLEDFLAKFTPQRVVTVDLKYRFNTIANINQVLDMCDANGGPERIIMKFDSPAPSTLMTDAAHLRGYLCMNYWGTIANSAAMDSQQGNWDIIGARFDDAAMMAQAGTYGKPVWAAVVPTLVGYEQSMTNGADIVMSTNPTVIPAVSWWN